MIFYTGSYTQKGAPALNPEGVGITCYNFNEIDGGIEFLHFTELRNPSYLAISEDLKYLFAAEEMFENQNPKVCSYKIGDRGKLTLINTQYIKGDYACHLAVIENRLVLANYVSGNALSYKISKDGRLKKCHQVIQHEGQGVNKDRQEAPHVHMVYSHKKGSISLVDLGIDEVKTYELIDDEKWVSTPEFDITIESGAGPRHVAMDKSNHLIYLLGELSGDVFVISKQETIYKSIQKISSVPKDYQGDFGGAAIRLHPNGQFLYTSCRGSNSIAAFRIDMDSKKLKLIAYYPTGGLTPRDFNIHPLGKWLIVANQDSNELVVFKVNKENGTLTKHSKVKTFTPTNILWLSR